MVPGNYSTLVTLLGGNLVFSLAQNNVSRLTVHRRRGDAVNLGWMLLICQRQSAFFAHAAPAEQRKRGQRLGQASATWEFQLRQRS